MLARWQFRAEPGYAAELQRLLEFSFGTFDAYSRNIRPVGWDACDIVANARPLQAMWARENGFGESASLQSIALQQIETFNADVVFMQDLSFFTPADLEMLKSRYVLAGQCSCPMPSPKNVEKFDVIFTSFPHYVPKFREAGVRPVYLPLAFDPVVLDRTSECDRDIDVSFVGGVGAPSHWKSGMQTLEAVARSIPSFRWWGYGVEQLPRDSSLRSKYQGQAFGVEMYQILRRSKIVVNRHGEVAQGWANNMRLFEATGMGACVLTEDAPNLGYLFPEGGPARYSDAADAVDAVRELLIDDCWKEYAKRGESETLFAHTYRDRMRVLSDEIMGEL
jgi:hypothetical protein